MLQTRRISLLHGTTSQTHWRTDYRRRHKNTAVGSTVEYAVAQNVGFVFYERQIFAVDLLWYVDDVDEEDVSDLVRCASPPDATRQHVAVDDNVCRPDVTVNSQETEVLQERHVLIIAAVVQSQHDVMHDVWYHETLCTTSTPSSPRYSAIMWRGPRRQDLVLGWGAQNYAKQTRIWIGPMT